MILLFYNIPGFLCFRVLQLICRYLCLFFQVLAKALYDYQGNGPGELSMRSGDMVGLRWRVDDNWYFGDVKGSSGFVPTSMVQVLGEQTQPPAPLCRALYDFDLNRLDPDNRKECLAFMKVCVYAFLSSFHQGWRNISLLYSSIERHWDGVCLLIYRSK